MYYWSVYLPSYVGIFIYLFLFDCFSFCIKPLDASVHKAGCVGMVVLMHVCVCLGHVYSDGTL